MSMTPAIRIGLRYAYVTDSGKAVDALAKVDITLQPRDFVSLIGQATVLVHNFSDSNTTGVTSLKQLEGKTLGITGIPYNRTMLEYCLTDAGVDLSKVSIVIVGFAPMPLLLSNGLTAWAMRSRGRNRQCSTSNWTSPPTINRLIIFLLSIGTGCLATTRLAWSRRKTR
jgi:NMT1/THI5 like